MYKKIHSNIVYGKEKLERLKYSSTGKWLHCDYSQVIENYTAMKINEV